MRLLRSICPAVLMMTFCAACFAQIGVSITIAPPALPVYDQPVCPGEDYIWTPGYWAYDYDIDDYYWVPGTWVLAPEPGLLWTPPYWGWNGTAFVFYDGYWGPEVGFYGGIVYGFGYFGVGYEGGRWQEGHFYYNRAVNNINVTVIHNVYETQVTHTTVTYVSYNGGPGGITARPTPQEEAAARERHVHPVAAQTQQVQAARSNPQLRASANQGKPPIAATAKPGAFRDKGVVRAKDAGAPYHPPARPTAANAPRGGAAENHSHPSVHANDLPPLERPAAPNSGNPKADQKYQQQQQKLYAKQQQERQKLQQKQDQDHQKLAQRNASDAEKQQLEQRHQQQTQRLQQRQQGEQQKLQSRQGGKPPK
jgi:WXXGXW repeat (2 copies)